ncbi:hypothetical protein Bhyg_04024 [Pseudolycoriella hygida]|uniref:Uncharacterized protein n=1 Tax=Pseudolycoriella hygida TaxID=35572 RepID=A0A9Q0NEP3_9DIPT|nr:hypothetical protein Bhyg_04024 [Pseudolycoriella hygida]
MCWSCCCEDSVPVTTVFTTPVHQQQVVTTQPHSTVYLEEPIHVVATPDYSTTTVVTGHTIHDMGTTYVSESYSSVN